MILKKEGEILLLYLSPLYFGKPSSKRIMDGRSTKEILDDVDTYLDSLELRKFKDGSLYDKRWFIETISLNAGFKTISKSVLEHVASLKTLLSLRYIIPTEVYPITWQSHIIKKKKNKKKDYRSTAERRFERKRKIYDWVVENITICNKTIIYQWLLESHPSEQFRSRELPPFTHGWTDAVAIACLGEKIIDKK